MLLLEVADGGTAQGFEPVADQVVAVATDRADRQRLWALRERQTELYATLPGLQKLDVSVRLADLDAAVAAIRAVVAGPVGRAADAPLAAISPTRRIRRRHDPRRAGGEDRPGSGSSATPSTATCTSSWSAPTGQRRTGSSRTVAELGGSISAEHGIGRLKVDQLHLARSAEQIDWMRRIKATVDPDGLLNPGVLIDPATRD